MSAVSVCVQPMHSPPTQPEHTTSNHKQTPFGERTLTRQNSDPPTYAATRWEHPVRLSEVTTRLRGDHSTIAGCTFTVSFTAPPLTLCLTKMGLFDFVLK